MKTIMRIVAVMAWVILWGSPAMGSQIVTGHIPKAITALHLQPTGRLASKDRLRLAIALPLRNREALTNFLEQLYDPASPNYRHYLSPEQFAEEFGPSEDDYNTLIAFANSNGLKITGTHPNRTLLDIEGSVADVERTFHVRINLYQHPTEKRTFYAPDAEPSLDLDLPVLHISGLDNYIVPHPMNLTATPLNNAATSVPYAGTGPSGLYLGTDLRKAYVPGVSLTGSGQAVGLLEFDGYYSNDIAAYAKSNGLVNVNVTNELIDGFSGIPSTTTLQVLEVTMDIDMALALAPGAQVIVYEETNNYSPITDDLLNRMATDDSAKQLSSSWGFYVDATGEQIFQQLSAQGQAFFGASGDDGAYSPGDAGFLTQWTMVGGTELTTGSSGQWSSETTWPGSGGGITDDPIPAWQTNISMTANHGSTVYRNAPDVAMVAEDVFVIYDNGVETAGGGTSAATPLWAAFTALANQQAKLDGNEGVGTLNPTLYAIGSGPNYALAFHDITTGNNTSSANPTNYYAVAGFDLCTGWGTPNGSNLINLLAISLPPTVVFTASPTTGVTPPMTVNFTSPAADSQGNTITNWSWSFGDGGTSTLQSPSHTYTTAGNFHPSLVTTNNLGFAVTGSGPSITLYYSTVVFTATPTNGTAPSAPVSFNSPSTDSRGQTITQWNWNFGDGTVSTSQSPSHTYTSPGSYQPTLIATNNLGFTDIGSGPSILVYTTPSQFSTTTNAGGITIGGYTGPEGTVVIPGTINGWPVESIANYAFENLTTPTIIIIPTGVTSIGYYAFYSCTNLLSVTIPNTVSSIGPYSFLSCSSLTNITVIATNSTYSSTNGALFNTAQTTLIQYPPGTTGSYPIPGTVTSISGYGFADSSLTSITIPGSVTSIGSYAFYFCENLTTLTVPAEVTSIGTSPCFGCTALASITVNSSNPDYSSGGGVLFNKNQTTLIQCPGELSGSYTVPNGVITIGTNAFYNCLYVTSITLPSSLTTISESAFQYDYNLTQIFMGSGLTNIEDYALYGCFDLAGIYFQGKAPGVETASFGTSGNYDPATLYYLPGTTGWSSSLGGLNALLWNPQAQTSGAAFGVRTNRFGFNITGTANIPVEVQATTNLINATWSSVFTGSITNGSVYFSDPQWTNYAGRYYRIGEP